MNVRLTLFSEHDGLLQLVGDFAKGLGCLVYDVPSAQGRGLQTALPSGDDSLLELLSYVALSATKSGVDVEEPLCRITYWHEPASAQVTMDLRVADFTLDRAASPQL